MRVLAVKQPWASLIAEGKKTIEVRSRPVIPENIIGRIAIYASRSELDKLGKPYNRSGLPRGYIIATAEIVGCEQYYGGLSFLGDDERHMIPCADLDIDAYTGFYGWELANVKKLETPIPFKMPRGCVVWTNADIEGLE